MDVLVARLGLPRTYLKKLAACHEIPFLDVNGRKRFDESQVREALREKTTKRKESIPCL